MPQQNETQNYSWFSHIDLNSISSYAQHALLMAFGYEFGGTMCQNEMPECTPNAHRIFAMTGVAAGFLVSKGINQLKYRQFTKQNQAQKKEIRVKNARLIEECKKKSLQLLGKLDAGPNTLLETNLDLYLTDCTSRQDVITPSLADMKQAHSRLLSLSNSLDAFMYDIVEAKIRGPEFIRSVKESLDKLFVRSNEDIAHALADDNYLEALLNMDDEQQLDVSANL